MKPSEYLARHVRVKPFWFEPTDDYFRDYPELSDVYCYSSDFPHVEGGRNSKQTCVDKLAHCGEEINNKFSRRNGQLLLP